MNREPILATRPSPPAPSGFSLQRRCDCGQHTNGSGACTSCSEKREKLIQRAPVNADSSSGVPPIVHEVLRSPGQPLDAATRSFMEPLFGHDFSGVRVHTDGRAAESARAVNAMAYTIGPDVVFGEAQYESGTPQGKQLLAHELTHVVQQRDGHAGNGISSPADTSEQEAASVAKTVVSGGSIHPTQGAHAALLRQVLPAAAPRAPAAPTLAALTATREAFNNTGAPSADNCAAVLPAGLGVDGPAIGENGMEMIFRINGAIPPGTEFEITRTRATGLWEQNAAGTWTRLGGNPSGTNDDHHDDDECQTPVGGRIFVIDTPGLDGDLNPQGVSFLGAGTVGATATAAVWKLSFAEWVIARNRPAAIPWTPISRPLFHRWHSIFSVALIGGIWTRVAAPSGDTNEIELGNLSTAGTTP